MSVLSRFYGRSSVPALNWDIQSYSPAIQNSQASQSVSQKAALIEKYPELANASDDVLAQLGQMTFDYTNIPYGPGWQDPKGRYNSDQMFGQFMKGSLQALGFWNDETNKPVLPSNQEEIDKWKFMDQFLRGMRSNSIPSYNDGRYTGKQLEWFKSLEAKHWPNQVVQDTVWSP